MTAPLMDRAELREAIWDRLRYSYNDIVQNEASPAEIKRMLTDDTDRILGLFNACIPQKKDLTGFEPSKDGGLDINTDMPDGAVGDQLANLAQYADAVGFNAAIDELRKQLGGSN